MKVAWEPADPEKFPAFEGQLTIEPERHESICSIELRGSYSPPFGLVGKAFDAVAGAQFARMTVRELLSRIRAYVEVTYREAERDSRYAHLP